LTRELEIRSRAAEQNMDSNEAVERKTQQDTDANLERSLIPQSRVEPVKVETESKSAPNVVSTTQGELKLLDVDNEEYKRKRAEALAKPNAVVGQITLQ
jgi:dipeptidase